jgi:HEAT repeat protein
VIRRSILLAVVLSATPSIALAQAAPGQTPSVAAVQAMLAGFEEGPGAEDWAALGPAAVPVLASIAADEAQPGFVRLRAIQAAGTFATPEARAMLRRALRSPQPLFVRAAALAMQRAFGASARAELAPLLDHADVAVREAAVRALGAIAAPGRAQGASDAERAIRDEVDARLRRRLAREQDDVLRERIERQLSGGTGSSEG